MASLPLTHRSWLAWYRTIQLRLRAQHCFARPRLSSLDIHNHIVQYSPIPGLVMQCQWQGCHFHLLQVNELYKWFSKYYFTFEKLHSVTFRVKRTVSLLICCYFISILNFKQYNFYLFHSRQTDMKLQIHTLCKNCKCMKVLFNSVCQNKRSTFTRFDLRNRTFF